MINILVTCANYPHDDVHPMQYVHVRNTYYKKKGLNVIVLNFNAEDCYRYEGIDVITYEHFRKNAHMYDGYFLICHAPNIRNHYLFLKKYGNMFKKHMLFFHGHEIVKISELYGIPYSYKKTSKIRAVIQNLYDSYKIKTWKKYLKSKPEEICVFVSNSLYKDFLNFTGLAESDLKNKIVIINNAISSLFEREMYTYSADKKYDFITIRSDMDNSIYCIDLVSEIARSNSSMSFLVIGKGSYYKYNNKPSNITWIDGQMNHQEMLSYIDSAKYALMPTRRDSQGLMTCELASYGIKVFTSDLAVCHEMFDDFENVTLLSEDEMLKYEFTKEAYVEYTNINNKFYSNNTMKNEVALIKKEFWGE